MHCIGGLKAASWSQVSGAAAVAECIDDGGVGSVLDEGAAVGGNRAFPWVLK